MKIPINSQLDLELVLDDLKTLFPQYKVKESGKDNIHVRRVVYGVSIVIKRGTILLTKRIYLNNWFGVIFVVLLGLGFVPAILFFGILWLLHKNKMKVLQNELGTYIIGQYEPNKKKR